MFANVIFSDKAALQWIGDCSANLAASERRAGNMEKLDHAAALIRHITEGSVMDFELRLGGALFDLRVADSFAAMDSKCRFPLPVGAPSSDNRSGHGAEAHALRRLLPEATIAHDFGRPSHHDAKVLGAVAPLGWSRERADANMHRGGALRTERRDELQYCNFAQGDGSTHGMATHSNGPAASQACSFL